MPNITRGNLTQIVAKQFKLSGKRAKEVSNEAAKKAGFSSSMTSYQNRKMDPRQQIKFAKNLGAAVKQVAKKYGVKPPGISKNDYQLRQRIKKAIATTTVSEPKVEEKPKKSAVDFLDKIRDKTKSAGNYNNSSTRQLDNIDTPAEKPDLEYKKVPLSDNLANIEFPTNQQGNNEPTVLDIG